MHKERAPVTAVSLALPALRLLRLVRVLRVARVAGAVRGVRLARLLSTINRGMRMLSLGFRRRGLGYLIVVTALVAITGAAGMYRFELDAPGGAGFPDYGTALWWTAMLLTTMGLRLLAPNTREAVCSVYCWQSTRSRSSATSPPQLPPISSIRIRASGLRS